MPKFILIATFIMLFLLGVGIVANKLGEVTDAEPLHMKNQIAITVRSGDKYFSNGTDKFSFIFAVKPMNTMECKEYGA